MNPRVKSGLLLLATLLIGMVLGALLNARLAEQRLERIAFLRTSRGFMRFIDNAIEPQDEAQRAAIETILERSASRMADHTARSRREVRMIVDSTITQLSTVLSKEQMDRLERRMEMGRRLQFDRRGRRGPPPR